MLAVILILSSIALINFNSILSISTSSEFSDLASTLVRARAYAMANNTYVWVGIQEVDASYSDAPGVHQSPTGFGRIAVCAVASNDGTTIYQSGNQTPYNLSTATNTTSSSGSPLTVVMPLRSFNNLHILAHDSLPNSITTNLPGGANSGSSGSSGSNSGASFYYLDTSSSTSSNAATTFQWPLTGTAQYTFGNTPGAAGTVIQFDPRGEAQIVTDDDTNQGAESDSILQWIEIDLEPTHGNSVPSTNSTTAAILIDGPSGAVSLYRS